MNYSTASFEMKIRIRYVITWFRRSNRRNVKNERIANIH